MHLMEGLIFYIFLQISILSKSLQQKSCEKFRRYRSFDGSCNNLKNPSWGQAGTEQRRFADATGNPMVDYADDVDLPRGGIPSRLPSPRLISNVLFNENGGPVNQTDSLRSIQHMAFGQLLAHDILKTRIPKGKDCCISNQSIFNDSDCFPFDVPTEDAHFTPGCKNFLRATKSRLNDTIGYRENINDITSYIDGSFIYGSSELELMSVRDGSSYLLKTEPGQLLPLKTGGQCVLFEGKCPIAGDDRVAVSPNLGVSHLLWIREHNRIATVLGNSNLQNEITQPYDKNETFNSHNDMIFQETRRIIIGMLQHITYNYYLPSILDQQIMFRYNLYSKGIGYDETYNQSVDASVRNGFGTAPFRFGHSQITAHQSLLMGDFHTMNSTPLEDSLQNPEIYLTNQGANIESYARWLTCESSNKIDVYMSKPLRDNLFVKTDPPGSDLAAMNIQRGRDQGTPAFNKWRQFCGLPKFDFEDFGNSSSKLKSIYRNADDIDFFVGGLLEKGENGGVSPTFSCVIGKQFEALKIGDRYWYERPDPDFAFKPEQLQSIKQGASLSKLFCQNFGLDKIQPDVFRGVDNESILVYCEDLPEIDLTLWKLTSEASTQQYFQQSSSIMVVFIFAGYLW